VAAGFFTTKIFHPNVSKGGEICVNVLKKDWTADMGLRHVLVVIRCLLIEPFPESALNEEAGRLLMEDYEAYASHARLMTSIHAVAAKRCVPPLRKRRLSPQS
jgi:ubiquitin-conjugating enzyme E2 S